MKQITVNKYAVLWQADPPQNFVIYRPKMNPTIRRNFALFPVLDWIAAITAHIPNMKENSWSVTMAFTVTSKRRKPNKNRARSRRSPLHLFLRS